MYLSYSGLSRCICRVCKITYWCDFRSGLVMGCEVPVPSFLPSFHYEFNRFLIFDFNAPVVAASLFLAYYLALEPVAAARIRSPFLPFIFSSVQIHAVALRPSNGIDRPLSYRFLILPTLSIHQSCYHTRRLLDCPIPWTRAHRKTGAYVA